MPISVRVKVFCKPSSMGRVAQILPIRDFSKLGLFISRRNMSKEVIMGCDKCSPLEGYQRAIHDLNSLQSRTRTISLAKYDNPSEILPLFKKQLELAGMKPEDLNSIHPIHISGTKGKGSTCAFIESILRHAGLRTGFYNSPHLIKVTERIKINGISIEDLKFTKYFREIYDKLERETKQLDIAMPSYFSFLTILAFHVFIQERVDCAIIEVGIGGEYDPTNILPKPVACGITTLDLDHTNILGNTIESIAKAKAGIIKPNVPVFTIKQDQTKANEVIRQKAEESGSALCFCQPFDRETILDLGIKGQAQVMNAALASHISLYSLSILHGDEGIFEKSSIQNGILESKLDCMPKFVRSGLNSCSWPGRCQILSYPNITFFLDGAHTKKSMENCLDWFSRAVSNSDKEFKNILMINIIGERDRLEILRPLTCYETFDTVIFSTNRINENTSKHLDIIDVLRDSKREKTLEAMQENISIWRKLIHQSEKYPQANILSAPSASEGLREIAKLKQQSGKSDIIYNVLVTGSLHFVGAVMQALEIEKSSFQVAKP